MFNELFLSPHLDDAALSCGGLIHKQVTRSSRVLILSVFAGFPAHHSFSRLAQNFHVCCGLAHDLMSVRRREDLKASGVLGAQSVHLDLLDSLYRTDQEGNWLYREWREIFEPNPVLAEGVLHQVASVIQKSIASMRFNAIYIPLGIGSHIDHILVKRACELLIVTRDIDVKKVYYYEDMPYVCRTVNGSRASLTGGLSPQLHFIEDPSWRAKLASIESYASQTRILWSGGAEMRNELSTYACSVGMGLHAERVWTNAC